MRLQYQLNNGHCKKKSKNYLFARVQNEKRISNFRQYINKNVNIYQTDKHQRTILMFAAQNCHYEIYKYVIDNYPKLISQKDENDMNVMHYVALSKEDDESLIQYITNKKFCYNKLLWMRNNMGELPKDLARKYGKKNILKKMDEIMGDTLSEYHYIARINNNNSSSNHNRNSNNNNNSDSEDSMDQDDDLIAHRSLHKCPPQQQYNIRSGIFGDILCYNNGQDNSSSNPKQQQNHITLFPRKRKRDQLNLSEENDDIITNEQSSDSSVLLSPNYLPKRRRLNGSGSFIGTSPQQPQMSPSPLPPLPPTTCYIDDNPFSLDVEDDDLNRNSTHHQPMFNLPSTILASRAANDNINGLQLVPPKLIRSRAINNMPSVDLNDNDLMKEMKEMKDISDIFYHGQPMTKQQFTFIRWYWKRIGRSQFLPMIIKLGYDDLDKFMTLTKDSCIALFGEKMGFALLLSLQSEIQKKNTFNLFGFGEYNINNDDMEKFNQRMKCLELAPINKQHNDEDAMDEEEEDENENEHDDNDNEDDDDDIDFNRNRSDEHHINFRVINSSDSMSDDIFITNNNNNGNKASNIEISWGGRSSDEDDDL